MIAPADDAASIFIEGVARAGNHWLAYFRGRPTDLATWERAGGHALRALQWCADCPGFETLAADLVFALESHMMRMGQWYEWVDLLQHIVARIQPAIDLDRLVRLNAELCTICFRLHRLDEALALAQRWYEIGTAEGHRGWQYAALIQMAETHLNAEAFDLALDCAEEAYALAEHLADPVKKADALIDAARALLGQGHAAEAERRLESAIALTVASGDVVWQAKARLFLGHAASAQGRWAVALERFRAALALVDGYGDQVGCGTILSAMGPVYAELGQWAEASAALAEAIRILERHGNTPAVRVAQQRLQMVARRMGADAEPRLPVAQA